MTDALLYALLAGLFGLLIGSFLNVCISRLPEDYSVVAPRSMCPRCGTFIAWYDNIPLLSFLVLGGRCRACRAAISLRYPLVELVTGGLFFLVVYRVGPGWAAVKWCLLAAILVELVVSDVETRILPDEFTFGGLVAAIMLAPVVQLPQGLLSLVALELRPGSNFAFASLVEALGAAALLSGAMHLLGTLYQRLRGREGLGFGDVKMVALLGAFLGLETALFGLIIGNLLGIVLGLAWIRLRGKDAASYPLPFGSFLGIGALLAAARLL